MSYIVDQNARLTGFGENQVAENSPIAQVSAVYGLRDDVFITEVLSGTTGANNGMFELSSGTSAISIATISTNQPIAYRPGQAIAGRTTALFGPPVSGLQQITGLLNTEAILGIGYNGTQIAILQARNGLAENQTLQITTPAGGAENATITVDGTGYVVPLTSGTVEHNAFEIAVSLNSQVPNYEFSSNGDTVEAIASLPAPGGSFAFTSATAVAAWTQITVGAFQTDTWINQGDWNGQEIPNLDLAKLNTFEIVYDGNVQFYIQNQSGEFILVHTIEWSNTQTEPLMRNPTQRAGWGIRNAGNVIDTTMKGGYCATFVQGKVEFDEPPRGDCVTEVPVTNGTEITLMVLRNRLTFNGILNRATVQMLNLQASSTSNRSLILKGYINPAVDISSGDLIFDYEDELSSVMEVAKDNVQLLTNQKPIFCFTTQGDSLISEHLDDLGIKLLGRDALVITGQLSSGAGAEAFLSLNWEEDL